MSQFVDTKDEILKYLQAIYPRLKSDGIEKIGLFGSFAKDSSDIFSDVDIVIRSGDKFVENHKGVDAFLYLDKLRENLSKQFGRRVDICDESGLKDKTVIKEAIYV